MAEAPKQRTVLITGTSSGIGLATAARLARDPQSRYMVIATMRDPRRSAALEAAVGSALGRTLRVERLDVNCEKSVRECMEVYGESVDVLVNNAGVGAVGPLEGTAMAELQRVVDTNVMGVVRAVRAVLPHMKRRRGGHIVVISSVMGRHGLLFNEVYSASKFAVEGFCESLAMQLLHFNVAVTLVEPGPVHTALERQLLEEAEEAEFPGADEETLRYFRCSYLPAARSVFSAMGQSPEEVAEAVVAVISSPRPPLRVQTNPRYAPLLALHSADRQGALSIRAMHGLLRRRAAPLRAR